MTPMCSGPLYSGWICAWYSALNFSWRSEALWVSTSAAMGPPLLQQVYESLVLLGVDAIAVVVVRERAGAHVGGVGLQAGDRHLRQIGVALGELRLEIGEHSEQVVREQDLPVGAAAGADADGRDFELLRDDARDLRRYCLELEHEAARVLDRERILEDLHGCVRGASLDPEAAEHGD